MKLINTLIFIASICLIVIVYMFLSSYVLTKIDTELEESNYLTELNQMAESKRNLEIIENLTEEIPLVPDSPEPIIVKATWYSRNGCINCDTNLIMANGKPLDNYAYAVAYDEYPLGTHITLCNQLDTICVDAEITDRMGNHNPNRIDLTPALFYEFATLDLGVIENLTLYCNDEELCY